MGNLFESNKVLFATIVAVLGWAAKYLNDLALATRANRLTRINDQIKDLYGPLFMLTKASKSAWQSCAIELSGSPELLRLTDLAPQQLTEWRRWVTTVLFPIVERMEALILARGDLLLRETVSHSADLVAHVESWRVLLSRWSSGQVDDLTALIPYPPNLDASIAQTFEGLLQAQAKLLRRW